MFKTKRTEEGLIDLFLFVSEDGFLFLSFFFFLVGSRGEDVERDEITLGKQVKRMIKMSRLYLQVQAERNHQGTKIIF